MCTAGSTTLRSTRILPAISQHRARLLTSPTFAPVVRYRNRLRIRYLWASGVHGLVLVYSWILGPALILILTLWALGRGRAARRDEAGPGAGDDRARGARRVEEVADRRGIWIGERPVGAVQPSFGTVYACFLSLGGGVSTSVRWREGGRGWWYCESLDVGG